MALFTFSIGHPKSASEIGHRSDRISLFFKASPPCRVIREVFCCNPRQPPLRGLAAPFASSALQVPRTFERLRDEGLVGLDYPLEAAVLLVPQPTRETVTPAETGGGVDPAFSGRLADTQAVSHRLGILQPLLLFP